MSPTDDAKKTELPQRHRSSSDGRELEAITGAISGAISGASVSGLSRRAFLGSGAAGALATGLLPALSKAAPVARDDSAVLGPGAVDIELSVNGETRALAVEPRVTLLDALRDRLDLTGAKKVCDRGTCGACTVLEDGRPIYACSRLAIESVGKKITTVEGLGTPEKLSRVQTAFVNHDAQQCGFCTPGFVVAVTALLDRTPRPTLAEAERELGGNFCRCGTYGGMKRALHELLGTSPGRASEGGHRG